LITRLLMAITAILFALIVGVLVLALFKPATFRIERQAVVAAPPAKVFPLIDNFHNWPAWSPWEGKDPAMERGFQGPESGKGAIFTWSGDKSVGQGGMEILESDPPKRVVIDMIFQKPFSARNTVTFTLTPEAQGTRVSWVMEGPSPLIGRVMQVFSNMDAQVGGAFESGLARMKAAAEK